MKIFIAGNLAEDLGNARNLAHLLEGFGHEITANWYDDPESQSPLQSSLIDIRGVRAAEVLLVIMHEPRNWQGTWCEVGMALILGTPVYFIGDFDVRNSNIYTYHPLAKALSYWPYPNQIKAISSVVR